MAIETAEQGGNWKTIDGVHNARDLGGYQVEDKKFLGEEYDSVKVKSGYAFRSANLTHVTEKGLVSMANLGIVHIFDLRSEQEALDEPFPEKLNSEVNGDKVTYQHLPMFQKASLSPAEIFWRYQKLITSPSSIPEVYIDFLSSGTECIKTIFTHILENKGPFLFHCAAGKDRTGVISLLYLLLAGVSNKDIATDYSLTTVGIKPLLPELRESYELQIKRFVSKFAKEKGVDLPFEQLLPLVVKYLGKEPEFDLLSDGFNNLVSSEYETMASTLTMFDEKFGDVYKYFEKMGFSDQEIETIKKRIVTGGNSSVL